jgi:pilus assembly protein Flp/PilA
MIDFTPRLWRVLNAVIAKPLTSERDDERGASAVEYGLLVAGIAAVIVAAVFLFGEGIFTNLFQETCDSIAQNMPGGCT